MIWRLQALASWATPLVRLNLAWAALLGLLAWCSGSAHEGLRGLQVLMLALPGWIWLRWPVQQPGWRWLRALLVTPLLLMFVLDAAVRAYLRASYGALPDSALVLSAAANTTPRESLEYLQARLPQLWPVLLAGTLALATTLALVGWMQRQVQPLGRPARGLLLVLLALCCVGYASKPWRRHHPAAFWPRWVETVAQLRSSWSDQAAQREQLLAQARQLQPRFLGQGPSTVVLVLTDSVNRDNMSLYGYARDTTPQLRALAQEEAQRLLVLRHAWSAEAATVPALAGLFGLGESRAPTQHLLALARQAGYRVWWMSNHDDIAIDQQHAQLADQVEMINREPGRSASSLDSELLDCLEEALLDPQPRKLIVLHLLGTHPHYHQRVPQDFHPFDAGGDTVERQLESQGRPRWLREQRQIYDGAMRYHDGVVAQTLRLTRRHAPSTGHGAWMYVSDHGQEVGHAANHAGHSPSTEAGYRIPALLWRTQPGFAPEAASRPFRVDWTAWTLAELLQISWQGQDLPRNVLQPGYRWQPPPLPLAGVEFAR